MTPVERTPYRDQPDIVAEYCACIWVHHEVNKQPVLRHIYSVDPTCPLHGDNVQDSPF